MPVNPSVSQTTTHGLAFSLLKRKVSKRKDIRRMLFIFNRALNARKPVLTPNNGVRDFLFAGCIL